MTYSLLYLLTYLPFLLHFIPFCTSDLKHGVLSQKSEGLPLAFLKSAGLVAVYPLSFCLCENILILPLLFFFYHFEYVILMSGHPLFLMAILRLSCECFIEPIV